MEITRLDVEDEGHSPWHLHIADVGVEYGDTGSAYCAAATRLPLFKVFQMRKEDEAALDGSFGLRRLANEPTPAKFEEFVSSPKGAASE